MLGLLVSFYLCHYEISFTKRPLGGTLSKGPRSPDPESGVLYKLATAVLRPAASESFWSLLGMQKLRPHPRPTESESAFEQELQAIRKFMRVGKALLYNTL